jgi:hypothetical protein
MDKKQLCRILDAATLLHLLTYEDSDKTLFKVGPMGEFLSATQLKHPNTLLNMWATPI